MSHEAIIPPTVLTPQQRAARVTAAFYRSKAVDIGEVMRLAGLSRRGAIDLLENLSGVGGIPITSIGGGKWVLVERDPLAGPPGARPMFDIHPNTRALIAFALAHSGEMRLSELAKQAGLTVPEVRWLLQRLRTGGLPIDETGQDRWSVRKR